MQCIYDLATYPEYQKPLRDEIRALASNGATLSLQNIGMLRKVDSFMKEVLRLSPGTLGKSKDLPASIEETFWSVSSLLLANYT